ncbi:MAG: hypothetical protein QNJ18_05495 [Xenococcaceae cyanobacterium MO_167.B52]|nr:hypothetical protein [Xenococcaceae cyanobacterium MO_167.B52]
MSQMTSPAGKDHILASFNQLLSQYQKTESKVATKEEIAEKIKNQKLVTKATDYTVDNIVNGMALLQLQFGSSINELTETLTIESVKLEELKKAIAVEKNHLQQLSQVKLVADTLHILKQEHQEKLRLLEEKTTKQKEEITKETDNYRRQWEQEQEEFASKIQEEDELLRQQKEQEEADYQYELARQRVVETDDYEEDKRQQETEVADLGKEKEKDWQQREQYLADNEKEFTENQEKIATFEDKIKEAYNKAKGDAIKEADKKAKVQADLLEKEWEAEKQGYEFKLESLQATIERQINQINELTNQLQETNAQSQNLAMKAFNNS